MQLKPLFPHASSEYVYEHLKFISAATLFGRHALVDVHDAGWHHAKFAEDFDNLSILRLPPCSPELKPVEQVWQWLRQSSLAQPLFSGYGDIV